MREHRPGSLVRSDRMTWLNPRYWFQRLVRSVNGRTIRADGPGQSSELSSCKGCLSTNLANDLTNVGSTVSVQIWVAGQNTDQARRRRQAAQERMNSLSATYAGSGSGRFFYDLWCERSGTDPLASEGDCIADAEYYLATQAVLPADLAALTHNIAQDLENVLGFPVAVEVEVVPVDEEIDAPSDGHPKRDNDADAIMAVVITKREHATILAALRHVARRGGFEDTAEVGIATNIDQWKAMSPDEINELGDHFNAGSDPMHNVCRCCEGRG